MNQNFSKIFTFIIALFCFTLTNCNPNFNETNKNEWVSLFNGKDIDDWIVKINHHKLGENFGNTFRIEDGN